MTVDYVTAITLIILLAIIFWLGYFVYISKLRFSFILGFIIGGVGWTIAYFLRMPILLYVQQFPSLIVVITIAASLAGIFEESFRYFFAKKWDFLSKRNGEIISFGIGWGMFEVFLIHTLSWVNIMLAIMLGIPIPGLTPLPTPDALFWTGLIGSYERNLAVAFHVGVTLIIAKALTDRKFLGVAIVAHALLDFITVYFAIIFGVYVAEAILFVLVVALYAFIWKELAIDLKTIFLKSDEFFIEQKSS